jgi:outer membrane protein assembly factor BamB
LVGAGPRATPTIHEETIYTYGATGRLTAITLEGKELWHQDTQVLMEAPVPQWGFASSPLIDGDLVIVQPGGRKGSVAAFDRSSGTLRWAAGRNPNGYSSPVIATLGGVRQIVTVTGDAILGLNPAEGAILWSHSWVTQFEGNIATPVIAGDLVFVSSGYQKGCVLLKIDAAGPGAVKKTEVYFRKNRVMANHHSTCVLRDGFLYGYDDQRLACVNLRTGQRPSNWEATDDNGRIIGKGSVTLVGDKLLGLTEAGTLFLAAADPKEFRFLGKLETGLRRECWAAPVVCEGRIYLRDSEKLIVLDVRP